MKIKKIDFLIAFYTTCVVLSELTGAKTVPLFTIHNYTVNGTVTLLVLPFIYSINDIIVEVFGKDRARSMVQTSILIIAFLLGYSLLVTNLPPSTRFAPTEKAYDTIFGTTARFAAASLIAFAISELADVVIFAKLKEKLGKTKLWLRTNASNFISELLDVIIFMTLAFYTLDKSPATNVAFIFNIGLPYYLLRCFMSLIETPIVYLGVRWLRHEK